MRQVALLRGINVGRAGRVEMARLRDLVTRLGYHDARTLLNSGNVVFGNSKETPAIAAARMEKALAEELGVSTRITVLTAAELARMVAENPLLEIATNPSRLLVAVLNDPRDRSKLAPLSQQDWGNGALAVGKRAAYLWCPDGVLASPLAQGVQRALGEAVTTRTWATMKKLHALASEE